MILRYLENNCSAILLAGSFIFMLIIIILLVMS